VPPSAVFGSRSQRWATLLMALALAVMPLYVIRPHLGPLHTTLLELVLVIALVAGFYAFWGELPWRNPYLGPALLLLAGASLGVVFTASTHAKALGIWKAYFIEPVAAGLIIAAIARVRARARWLLAGLALAGAIGALANLAVDGRALLLGTYSVTTPPVAIYNSSNDVALFLEPLAALALSFAIYSRDRLERRLGWILYLVYALAIAASFSRGGWLALGALTLVTFMFHPWRWRVLGALVLITLLALGLSGKVRHRVGVEFNFHSPDNTIALRQSLWRSALNMLRHRPLGGGGLDGFKYALQPYRAADYHENLIYPHDLFLNFWSETGLVGLAGFCWLLVQWVRTIRRGLESGPWARLMAVTLSGALVAVVLHGLVDAPYFKNDLALVFWTLLGMQIGSLSAEG
ncbi:MAG: O-antigen ligase family protein, partial [Candidatus Dormibacteraceae bacterium]